MSEREPITGELRELMGGVEPRVDEDGVVTAKYVTPEAWGEFVRRCDAIDAVHAGLERENAELRERVAELDNERGNMHDGWVRLPLDADGVPWHIGDSTESGQTVEAMGLNKHGWHFVGTVNEIDPSIHRHHHAPTVEDVLREFLDEAEHFHSLEEERDAISEYARRLTLAGDAS
jgi:hypothetical protein